MVYISISIMTSTSTTEEELVSSNPSKLTTYQPVCQRCFNPLQLDQDFEHLQKTELMSLIGNHRFLFFSFNLKLITHE